MFMVCYQNNENMLQAPENDGSGVVSADAAKKRDFEVGRGKKDSSKIHYASTIEDAYKDLDKILKKNKIKKINESPN